MSSNRNIANLHEPATTCEKWVSLQDAGGDVSSAARLTLNARLAAVRFYLPRASVKSKESIEDVHQLRISTRRVIATLQVYEEVVPREHARWIRNQMKRIRRVAGVARDLDVLAQRYRQIDSKKHKRLLRQLAQLRRKARHAIDRLNHKLIDRGQFKKQSTQLLQSIRCESNLNLSDFARLQLSAQVKCFFKHAKRDLDQIEQLHRFRIQAKKLRYVIELLSDALPKQVRSEIYPIICKAQDLLGELNDHFIASERIKRLAQKKTRPRHARQFKLLCKKEKRKMERAKLAFRQWWTPDFAAEFESSMQQMLVLHPV